MSLGRRLLQAVQRAVAAPEAPMVAAALLCLVAVPVVVDQSQGVDGPTSGLSVALLTAFGATVPLALVRVQLLVASVAIGAAVFAGMVALEEPPDVGLVSLPVTMYLLGRRGSRWMVPLLLPFVGYGTLAGFVESTASRWYTVGLASASVVAAAAGIARRMWVDVTTRHVSQQTVADALLENVARGERVRIARELHDVVAHHISMVVVQAETARLTTPGLPADGADRLVAIGDTARTALTEMRRLLGVLREDQGPDSVAARQPQPGLQQLVELVDEARAASGAHVRLIVQGRVAPLDPGVELTVYRVVQEALTNARRHAPGAAVDVELRYTDDSLLVRIRDNGPGPARRAVVDGAAEPTGHGLLGMRERVATVGGDLRIGPAPVTGGLLVEAVLPVAQARAHPTPRLDGALLDGAAAGGAAAGGAAAGGAAAPPRAQISGTGGE